MMEFCHIFWVHSSHSQIRIGHYDKKNCELINFLFELSDFTLVQIALERESTNVWELSFVVPADHGVFQHTPV